MYKNFKLTEEEKQEILKSHISHGYKKPLNEIYDDEYDVVRGNPDFKLKIGKPTGDYLDDRNAARQFQQDFQNEFPDPSEEPVPFWEKDQARPSGEDLDRLYDGKYEYSFARVLPKENDPSSQEIDKIERNEELIQLNRKIASLQRHRNQFGGDDELDMMIKRLIVQASKMHT